MKGIRCHIAGKKIRTRVDALKAFWEDLEAHNGDRRKKPQDIITIRQVRQLNTGGFDVLYDIPAKYDPLRRNQGVNEHDDQGRGPGTEETLPNQDDQCQDG